jgi:hypothetical protein
MVDSPAPHRTRHCSPSTRHPALHRTAVCPPCWPPQPAAGYRRGRRRRHLVAGLPRMQPGPDAPCRLRPAAGHKRAPGLRQVDPGGAAGAAVQLAGHQGGGGVGGRLLPHVQGPERAGGGQPRQPAAAVPGQRRWAARPGVGRGDGGAWERPPLGARAIAVYAQRAWVAQQRRLCRRIGGCNQRVRCFRRRHPRPGAGDEHADDAAGAGGGGADSSSAQVRASSGPPPARQQPCTHPWRAAAPAAACRAPHLPLWPAADPPAPSQRAGTTSRRTRGAATGQPRRAGPPSAAPWTSSSSRAG